jgi:hypothetical protein
MAGTLHRPAAREHVDLDHGLAALTLALAGIGALLLTFGATVAGTWCGVLGMAAGLVAQMVSRTRNERWVDVIGILACFLVLAIGAAQGGLP